MSHMFPSSLLSESFPSRETGMKAKGTSLSRISVHNRASNNKFTILDRGQEPRNVIALRNGTIMGGI